MKLFILLPVEKIMLIHMENTEIASTSSMLDAAMTRVEMPFPSPYPSFFNFKSVGTTTAGEIAQSRNLKYKDFYKLDLYINKILNNYVL